ncbi:hypothetical protein FACS189487_10410 [Campylobacterota bacterium]|nr:hypothetical protein FACS189487_10410 [Campylobacterota bacterium]
MVNQVSSLSAVTDAGTRPTAPLRDLGEEKEDVGGALLFRKLKSPCLRRELVNKVSSLRDIEGKNLC